jgi:hypothetical protein
MDWFGIGKHAIEIEQDGIEVGHRARFSGYHGVSLDIMPTEEEMKTELDRLRAENEMLKKPARTQLYLKVSEKGALSVYGLGRFPVTLYREQWERLLGLTDAIRQFIVENDAQLKKKE